MSSEKLELPARVKGERARQPLQPLHYSVPLRGVSPYGMKRMSMDADTTEMLQRVALDIFADMTNAGRSFQQSLAAIYLSGLQHAAELSGATTGSGE